jgi:enoyl-CoA hydratase/carnithine racemase
MSGPATPILENFASGAATITLNAPERRNALSTAMREALLEGIRRYQDDDSCRCIILTGAAGTFCSGGDISEMTPPDGVSPGQYAEYRIGLLQDIIRLIVHGTKPVVAMVSGHAAGAGMSIACACDYVVVEDNARFAASFARLGLIADCGLTWTLPRRVGPTRAQELLTTGRSVGAEEAARLGIADEFVGSGKGMAAAVSRAELYALAAPLAVARTRLALIEAPADLEAALALETLEQGTLRLTEDHNEARRAFAEKRAPKFLGR